MRYFIDYQGKLPKMLYRFNSDEDVRILVEEVWRGGWSPTNEVVKGLVYGDAGFEEVNQEVAKKSFPEAF